MSAASERSHRSALVLSTLLTLVGSCGACNGAQRFTAGPPPSADMIEIGDEKGARELREFYEAAGETYLGSPDRRPLGIANLIVSMMLVVGSFMLGSRRASTIWFVTNALAANLVYIVAECAFFGNRLLAQSPLLARKLAAVAIAQAPPGGAMTPASALADATTAIGVGGLMVLLVAVLKFALHAMLIAKVRSPDIAEFLAATADE